ncbi:phage tail tip lysozyme [Pseudomonas sp. LP_7_YM]|uniref:phage tail tip lysozyme n=1 Tax=Pseudomonas sp. LP_7_YM TaxID=2485137 RepID=UPI00105FB0C1|nr:phage tail tip lysozyme [Pseudomonas sp. LP_7_YM]TDV61245.1 hypothetical protein EC915_10932 [Pseudomonas sp. LP_7_YM]
MSEKVIDTLLLRLGVTVDEASLEKGAQAVTDLDDAINKVMRNREKISLDRISKNLAEAGATARHLEQDMGQLDKTLIRVPQSMSALQARLGSATQQMGSLRSEMQAVVGLLSSGASAAGLGPLSGSVTNMLAGGSPLALATAGIEGLASNSMKYASGALKTEVSAGAYGVSKADFQNLNRFGKKITGDDDVGTQILQAAQKVKADSLLGKTPTDIARYGGVPSDFTDAFERPTMDVVDTFQKQLVRAPDPLIKQGIGSSLGLSQSAIVTLGEDYRTGIKQSDKPGSTYTDQDVANARAFENSLVDLTIDFERLRNKLGAEFLPSLDGFIKRVDGLLVQNGIADKVMHFAETVGKGDFKGTADALKDPDVKSAVSTFVHDHVPMLEVVKGTYLGATEGWDKGGVVSAYTGAVKGYFGSIGEQFPTAKSLLGEGFDAAERQFYEKMPSAHIDDDPEKPLRPEIEKKLGKQQRPDTDNSQTKQDLRRLGNNKLDAHQRAIKFFTENGYTRPQSYGIVANLSAESGMRPDAVGGNGKAYGLAQWQPERQQDFEAEYGKDIHQSNEKEQLEFVLFELRNKERAAGDALSKAKTARRASDVFRQMYERPADNPENADRRNQLSEQLGDRHEPKTETTQHDQVRQIEQKLPVLSGRSEPALAAGRVSYQMLPEPVQSTATAGQKGSALNDRGDVPKVAALASEVLPAAPSLQQRNEEQRATEKRFDQQTLDALLIKTQAVAEQSQRLSVDRTHSTLPYLLPSSDALPADTPEAYNMVANPPTPPSADAAQAQPAGSEGNIVHIDARGSTDVHHITSEAMRAASDYFQGQMTVAMSHFSTDLDQ